MSYRLKPGISFCHVADRMMFLDLAADRYFCLSPAGERSVAKLIACEPLGSEDRPVLENLVAAGPLDHGEGELAPCPAIEPPLASFLDEHAPPVSLRQTSLAAATLLATILGLKLRGLRRVITRLRRSKARSQRRDARPAPVVIAAAFARLRAVATQQDNCLSRSIAVATRLVAVGAHPELVIAVKLQPFGAHAWVQCDGRLVNDRHEFVRDYTPILIV